jgi:hypothetical protein
MNCISKVCIDTKFDVFKKTKKSPRLVEKSGACILNLSARGSLRSLPLSSLFWV